jgi:glycosyltransferase involved in cell wall biosynthesis
VRIAQIAPLAESVPPKYYGGTERIVSYLTEELVRMGHEVILFASGDSVTSARLEPICHCSLRRDKNCIDDIAHHMLMVEKVFQRADEFDVIHSHIDYFPFSVMRRMGKPSVTTLHGRLDLPDLVPIYREFNDIPVISISDAQREFLHWINWQGTVYHGLPEDLYTFREESGKYLAFLGRISPEKRVDTAIAIAKQIGMELKIAAKVDNMDREYFDTAIMPLLDHPLIEYVGEIGETEKNDFLGNAYALLFPIDWPEPFGIVMIEAMACGTPIIAHNRGSVPELMSEGVTGFIVENAEDAAIVIEDVQYLSRRRCREVFEQRFTARRMAEDYLRIYKQLILKTPKQFGRHEIKVA